MRFVFIMIAALMLATPASGQDSRGAFYRELHQHIGTYVRNNPSMKAAARRDSRKTLQVTFSLSVDGSIVSAKVVRSQFSPQLNRVVEREMQRMPRMRNVPDWAAGSKYNLPIGLGGG